MKWPLVTRKRMEAEVDAAKGSAYGAGYSTGVRQQNEFLAGQLGRVQKLIGELIVFIPKRPGQNSDTMTLFFTDTLRHIQGDDSYIRFVVDQVTLAVYQVVRRSVKGF